ncbi:hypothetical protein RJ640_012581 [Escallonia rubra]|uniref:Uncharacterized protein n=1 Tax=Escallonia rubra TaxID=112253 RepID=A0AA88UEY9_9ASTE|nr:hypothetical protein RJ640_012581 [Escallonia rubra]
MDGPSLDSYMAWLLKKEKMEPRRKYQQQLQQRKNYEDRWGMVGSLLNWNQDPNLKNPNNKKRGEENEIDLRDEASLFLEKAELGALTLLLDLLAELLQLLLFGVVLLLRLPHVLYVPKAARVPSLLVQKLQRHLPDHPHNFLDRCLSWSRGACLLALFCFAQ